MGKKVLVYGAFDAGNLGDDYMMHVVRRKINEQGIVPFFFKTSGKNRNYFNEKSEHYIVVPHLIRYRNKVTKLLKIIKWQLFDNSFSDYAALIFMGGGYTYDGFGVMNLLKIYSLVCMAKKKKLPIFFMGQTVGPCSRIETTFLLKKIYKKATYISVREKYSNQWLSDNKFRGDFTGDDAYLYIPHTQKKRSDKNVILTAKDFTGYELYKNAFFDFACGQCKKEHFNQAIVIPFTSDELSKEYQNNYELYHFLQENGISSEFFVPKNVEELAERLEKTSYVIGTAYHLITLGLIFDCIPFASYYGDYYSMKIQGILERYDAERSNSAKLGDLDYVARSIDIIEDSLKITSSISDMVNNSWNKILEQISNGER